MRARSTLFTLFAEFLWPEGKAPVALLVRWMKVLGFSEPAVRAAVSRSAARGWLVREPGRPAVYRLSPRVRWQVAQVQSRLYDPEAPWDGRLRVLLHHVPEDRRGDRDRFRKELVLLGFGAPYPGVWINPSPRLDAARDLVRFYGLEHYVELFLAERRSLVPLAALLEKSYDLAAARAAHEAFLRQDWPTPKAPEAAFKSLVRLVHERRKTLFLDPGLPPDLLPEDWPGTEARKRFLALRETLRRYAEPFLTQTASGVPVAGSP